MSGERLRALVIEHEQSAPSGYLGEWLEHRGADQELYRITSEQRALDARDYGLIVSLGSESAAYDDATPWLGEEKRLLLQATAEGVPVLGICFGSQLLARVLGGESLPAERAEIGWRSVHSQDTTLIPEGPWFQWHFDTFKMPPGARLLADNAAGPQAYVLGPNVGLQFHPEVTPQIIETWVQTGGHELDRERIDPDQLLAETHDRAGAMRAAAWELFDSLLARERHEHAA